MSIVKTIIQKTVSLLNKLDSSLKDTNPEVISLDKPISNEEMEVMVDNISSSRMEESTSKTTVTTVTFSLGEQIQYDIEEVEGLTIEDLIEKASESLYFEDNIVNIKEDGVIVKDKSQPVKVGATYTLYTKVAVKA
jgi:uncharacterized protein YjdB